jgi:hypothetical protein
LVGEEKPWWSWGSRFEGARRRRSDGERIILLVWVESLAFGVGWNLSSPSANAVLAGPLEGVVRLKRERVGVIQGLALATTVREFTLLADTSW